MDEVTVEAETVVLRSGGRVLDTQRQDALARVYAVFAGADLSVTVTDVALRVFRFDDRLWVLPWTTAGVEAAIAAIWPEPRQRAEQHWEAVIDQLPRDWRRLLETRLRPTGGGLLVAPLSELPAWRIRHEGSNSHFVGEHAYPFLDALIGGWFHQDFDIAGDTLAVAIASFRRDTNSEDWAETRADIARLLRRYDDVALPHEFHPPFCPRYSSHDAAPQHASMAHADRRIAEAVKAVTHHDRDSVTLGDFPTIHQPRPAPIFLAPGRDRRYGIKCRVQKKRPEPAAAAGAFAFAQSRSGGGLT